MRPAFWSWIVWFDHVGSAAWSRDPSVGSYLDCPCEVLQSPMITGSCGQAACPRAFWLTAGAYPACGVVAGLRSTRVREVVGCGHGGPLRWGCTSQA